MTNPSTEQEMVSCGCGDMYAPMTFGAAWIYATGKCENCCAAEDAAPVQLPEPELFALNTTANGSKTKLYEQVAKEYRNHPDVVRFYTEHQVRQLLANHALAKR